MTHSVRVRLNDGWSPDMWDLHKAVVATRSSGDELVFVDAWLPINMPPLGVAIESGSLYLIGVRPHGRQWFEFMPDTGQSYPGSSVPPQQRLPGSRWIMAGARPSLSSYRALKLDWLIRNKPGATGSLVYPHRPVDLLRFFHGWDGQLDSHDARLSMVVLIFLFCEALRFRSVDTVCFHWLSTRNQALYGADGSIPHMAQPLTITADLLHTIQNWDTAAAAGSPDVWIGPA